MKLKALAAAVATSLATASFVSDLMASFAIADDIVIGKLGHVHLSNISSEKAVVVQGYPQVEPQDEDIDMMLFRGGYIAYSFKIVSLIVVATDLQSAQRKARKRLTNTCCPDFPGMV